MIFEIWNDIVPILFSLSFYVAFITAHIINGIVVDYAVQHKSWVKDSSVSIKLKSAADRLITDNLEEQQSFITRITKRKEAPEDDADYQAFSLNSMSFLIRGGKLKLWKTNLYSLSLRNMAY